MLKVTVNKNCRRLFWLPEDKDKEAKKATYFFRGRSYQLEVDGRVDDVILEAQDPAEQPLADIDQLVPHLPRILMAHKRLMSGERVGFAIIEGLRWTAKFLHQSDGFISYILQNGQGQFANVRTDLNHRFCQLTLRTRGPGISHEISARPDDSGQFKCIAEAVTVFPTRR